MLFCFLIEICLKLFKIRVYYYKYDFVYLCVFEYCEIYYKRIM